MHRYSPSAYDAELNEDERELRVAALKSQVELGTYHVPGEAISDKMLRSRLATFRDTLIDVPEGEQPLMEDTQGQSLRYLPVSNSISVGPNTRVLMVSAAAVGFLLAMAGGLWTALQIAWAHWRH